MKLLIFFVLSALVSCAGTQNSQNPALKIEIATSQEWSGGAYGSGNGTDYVLRLRYAGARSLNLDTLWVGERPFEAEQRQVEDGLYEIVARYTIKPSRDPNTGEPDYDQQIENPEKSEDAPQYEGAGMLVYRLDNKRQTLIIESFEQLPALHYP